MEEDFWGLFSHFLPQLPKQVGSCLMLFTGGEGRGRETKTKTESSYYGNITKIAMGTGAPEQALSRI